MKFAIYDYNKSLNIKNLIFEKSSWSIGENLNAPARELRAALFRRKHELNTLDMYPIEQLSGIIFFDMPGPEVDLPTLKARGLHLYLVMLESNIIKPENSNTEKHPCFDLVFTWNDDLVDNNKYFKIMIAHEIPHKPEIVNDERIKFATMIAGNKKSKLPNELYSERLRVIKWFEKNQPSMFDLYGFGWDSFDFPPVIGFRSLNRFKFLRRLFAPKLKSYRGRVDSKKEVLQKYKFHFAYENVFGDKGYITEKVFDSLFSFSVPVYLGAPDISDYVPDDCFIDKRNFASYEELFSYLNSMTDEEYQGRQAAIYEFLTGKKIELFSAEHFGESIAETIIRKL